MNSCVCLQVEFLIIVFKKSKSDFLPRLIKVHFIGDEDVELLMSSSEGTCKKICEFSDIAAVKLGLA